MHRNHHQQLELPVDHLGLTLDHGLASSLPGYKQGVDTSGRDLGLEGIVKHRVGAVQSKEDRKSLRRFYVQCCGSETTSEGLLWKDAACDLRRAAAGKSRGLRPEIVAV